MKKLVKIINFLNKENVNYSLIDEYDQIRIELFLKNSHGTQGDYIVVCSEGKIHMNLFTDLPLKNIKNYIKTYNK